MTNKYRVPKRQWRKWSEAARKAFNDMYYVLTNNGQEVLLATGQEPIKRTHWKILAWNIAWTAADNANG